MQKNSTNRFQRENGCSPHYYWVCSHFSLSQVSNSGYCQTTLSSPEITEKPDHFIIIFGSVGKRTVRTIFYPSPVFFDVFRITGTVFFCVRRTVAEQAVKVLKSFMTGKIPALLILKKSM